MSQSNTVNSSQGGPTPSPQGQRPRQSIYAGNQEESFFTRRAYPDAPPPGLRSPSGPPASANGYNSHVSPQNGHAPQLPPQAFQSPYASGARQSSILSNVKLPPASRNGCSDRETSTAELLDQQQVVAISDSDISEPTSTEQAATSSTSTPSPRFTSNKAHDIYAASTHAGIKKNVVACAPCECRALICDGVRPMCDQCEMNGRRCFYEE